MKTKIRLPSAKKVASYTKKAVKVGKRVWKSDAGNAARKEVMKHVNEGIKKSKPVLVNGASVAGSAVGGYVGGPTGAMIGGELGSIAGKAVHGYVSKVGQKEEAKIDRRLKR